MKAYGNTGTVSHASDTPEMREFTIDVPACSTIITEAILDEVKSPAYGDAVVDLMIRGQIVVCSLGIQLNDEQCALIIDAIRKALPSRTIVCDIP